MRLLRSRLFAIIIAVCTVGGYSQTLLGRCFHEPVAMEHSDEPGHSHSHSDSDRSDGHACHCICHQFLMNEPSAAPFEPVLLTVISVLLERVDNPPDAIPLGIDHPPQLA